MSEIFTTMCDSCGKTETWTARSDPSWVPKTSVWMGMQLDSIEVVSPTGKSSSDTDVQKHFCSPECACKYVQGLFQETSK